MKSNLISVKMEKLQGWKTSNSFMDVKIELTTNVLSKKQSLNMAIAMLEEELRGVIND